MFSFLSHTLITAQLQSGFNNSKDNFGFQAGIL